MGMVRDGPPRSGRGPKLGVAAVLAAAVLPLVARNDVRYYASERPGLGLFGDLDLLHRLGDRPPFAEQPLDFRSLRTICSGVCLRCFTVMSSSAHLRGPRDSHQ